MNSNTFLNDVVNGGFLYFVNILCDNWIVTGAFICLAVFGIWLKTVK